MATTSVQGLSQAKKAFQALPQIARDRFNDATVTTAQEIVRHAQDRLTSSPSIITRALYTSVKWTINKKTGRAKAGVSSDSVGEIAPRRRAHFVEFGTRHSDAEPFMIPAAESQEKPYLDRCRHVGKHIEKDMAAIGMRNL